MAVTIAVISDTHQPRGTRMLPVRCVDLLRGADLILHGGDFVSVEFLDELRALGPPVEAVSGNMDEPALKESLPKQRVVEIEGARIGMVHIPGPATGRSARLRVKFPDCGAGGDAGGRRLDPQPRLADREAEGARPRDARARDRGGECSAGARRALGIA